MFPQFASRHRLTFPQLVSPTGGKTNRCGKACRGDLPTVSHTFPHHDFKVWERSCHCCGERLEFHYAGLLGCRAGRSFYRPAMELSL